MVTKEQVETVLMQVRPYMQADGGDIELVEVDGNSVGVRFTGLCSGCPSAAFTLQFGVEMALREAIPGFEAVHLV
jgi:Fe-S cluster biogenesis protein NfuA